MIVDSGVLAGFGFHRIHVEVKVLLLSLLWSGKLVVNYAYAEVEAAVALMGL